jgi:RiboL-PSP-HEPN
MSLGFDSSQDFYQSLEAVNTLIRFAEIEEGKGNQDNRILFLKLSVVSMVTRFQVFVEAILAEFAFKLKNSDITFDKLPVHLRLNSVKLLSENFIMHKKLTNKDAYNERKISAIKTHISAVGSHFSSDIVDDSLTLKIKFPLGKTGRNELIDLFSQIEGEDIFEEANFDINDIDGLLTKRHLIVHHDIFQEITDSDITRYQQYLNIIVEYIDNFMGEFIRNISEPDV